MHLIASCLFTSISSFTLFLHPFFPLCCFRLTTSDSERNFDKKNLIINLLVNFIMSFKVLPGYFLYQNMHQEENYFIMQGKKKGLLKNMLFYIKRWQTLWSWLLTLRGDCFALWWVLWWCWNGCKNACWFVDSTNFFIV